MELVLLYTKVGLNTKGNLKTIWQKGKEFSLTLPVTNMKVSSKMTKSMVMEYIDIRVVLYLKVIL